MNRWLCWIAFSTALVASAAAAPAGQAPLEVKGFRLGDSRAELLNRFKFLECRGDICSYFLTTCDIERVRSCGGLAPDYTIGDIPVNWMARIDNDRVVMVALLAGEPNFDDLVSALRQKYGKPTSDAVGKEQNAFGASFADRIVTWKRHDGEVQAVRRFTKLTLCAVLFTTKDAVQSARRAAEEKSKKGAAGL